MMTPYGGPLEYGKYIGGYSSFVLLVSSWFSLEKKVLKKYPRILKMIMYFKSVLEFKYVHQF